MKLEKFLQDNYNYNPEIKDNIKTYIEQWKSWYQRKCKRFSQLFYIQWSKESKQKKIYFKYG